MPLLLQEEGELKQNKATVQATLRTIKAREDSLRCLSELNTFLEGTQNWQESAQLKAEVEAVLYAHRMLTLAVVESLLSWQDALITALAAGDLPVRVFPFMWEGVNYLTKMRDDVDWLSSSEFAQAIQLTTHDPLILAPTKTTKNAKHTNFCIVTAPVLVSMWNQLKSAEAVIYGEVKLPRTKASTRTPRLRKGDKCKIPKLLKTDSPEKQPQPNKIHTAKHQQRQSVILTKPSPRLKETADKTDRAHKMLAGNIAKQMIEQLIAEESKQIAQQGYAAKQEETRQKTQLQDTELQSDIFNSLVDCILPTTVQDASNEELSAQILDNLSVTLALQVKQETVDLEREAMALDLFDDLLSTLTAEVARVGSQIAPPPPVVVPPSESEELSEEEWVEPAQQREAIQVPASKSMSRASSQQELIHYEYFLDADYSDLSDLVFEPLGIEESSLHSLLSDYFEMLPSQLKAVLEPVHLLISETRANNNPCWLWALLNNKIVGLLVYSEYAAAPSTATIAVHHCSCLSFSGYPHILAKAEKYINTVESPDHLRIDFFVDGIESDLPRDFKAIVSNQQFRWKTQNSHPGSTGNLLVFGKDNGQEQTRACILQVCGTSGVQFSSTEVIAYSKKDADIIYLANRMCLISAVQTLFRTIPRTELLLPMDGLNRLQTDLLDMLSILNSSESAPFSVDEAHLTEDSAVTQSLLSKQWQGLHSVARMSENCHLQGYTSTTHQPLDRNYQYLHFHAGVQCRECENAKIYILPTSAPHLQAFVVDAPDLVPELRASLRNFNTDLFYKVEGLLRSADEADQTVSDLWLPQFELNASSQLMWMRGLSVPGPNKHEFYVKECLERLIVTVSAPSHTQPGSLLVKKPRGAVVSHAFIFGLRSLTTAKVFEGPLFAGVIQEKDWISAKDRS